MPLRSQVRSSPFEYFYQGFAQDHILMILFGSHKSYTYRIHIEIHTVCCSPLGGTLCWKLRCVQEV